MVVELQGIQAINISSRLVLLGLVNDNKDEIIHETLTSGIHEIRHVFLSILKFSLVCNIVCCTHLYVSHLASFSPGELGTLCKN